MTMKLVNGEWQDVPDWFDGSGSEANLLGAKNDSPTGIYTFKDKNGYQWNIMNGVAMPFNSTGYVPTQDVVDMFAKNGIRVGTQQDVSNAINEDAPGNGAGKGSMKEGILSAIKAAAAMYGAGNLLGGTSGLDISGGLDMPAGVDAPWGVNERLASMAQNTPGPWADTAAYPNYTQQILNGTMDYGKLGAELGANAFDTAGLTTSLATTAGKTALQRLLSGDATATDYAELGLKALPGVLGAFGASQQSGQLGSLATQFGEYGAPSRARYEASFAPGFTMANDPGYQDALDASSKATLHSLSVNGNPAGSPNAWAASLADNNAKFAYPALQSYRTSALNASGIPNYNAAAPGLATGQLQSNANVYNGIGAAIGNVTNPQQSLADILKQYQESNGGSSIFKVAA
jgi:hypothetical protein